MLGYYKLSLTGSAHLAMEGGVCQDFSDARTLANGWVIAVIADGLGSAAHSEIGSRLAVETVISFVERHLPGRWHEESLISLLRIAYHEAMKAIRKAAAEAGHEAGSYDTTLTALIYNGADVVYGQVGDGGIVALSPEGEFSALTTAQKGEAFNETFPLRSGPENWKFGTSPAKVCSLLMMTDGIFDIAVPWLLADTEQPVYVNFVRRFMDRNRLKLSTADDFEIARGWAEEFFTGKNSARITDDKTIVCVMNTDVTPKLREDDYYREPDWEALAEAHRRKLYGDPEDGGGLRPGDPAGGKRPAEPAAETENPADLAEMAATVAENVATVVEVKMSSTFQRLRELIKDRIT